MTTPDKRSSHTLIASARRANRPFRSCCWHRRIHPSRSKVRSTAMSGGMQTSYSCSRGMQEPTGVPFTQSFTLRSTLSCCLLLRLPLVLQSILHWSLHYPNTIHCSKETSGAISDLSFPPKQRSTPRAMVVSLIRVLGGVRNSSLRSKLHSANKKQRHGMPRPSPRLSNLPQRQTSLPQYVQ